MDDFSPDAFRKKLRKASGFNELFELFRYAMDRKIDDFEIYRELLWNNSLKPDELFFFARKLADVFPRMGYDTYMWLANVFELHSTGSESVDLAFLCLKKAAGFDSQSERPYMAVFDIYNHDLKIPTPKSILSFLRTGLEKVTDPRPLYERLALFYRSLGNEEMFHYYKRKSAR